MVGEPTLLPLGLPLGRKSFQPNRLYPALCANNNRPNNAWISALAAWCFLCTCLNTMRKRSIFLLEKKTSRKWWRRYLIKRLFSVISLRASSRCGTFLSGATPSRGDRKSSVIQVNFRVSFKFGLIALAFSFLEGVAFCKLLNSSRKDKRAVCNHVSSMSNVGMSQPADNPFPRLNYSTTRSDNVKDTIKQIGRRHGCCSGLFPNLPYPR